MPGVPVLTREEVRELDRRAIEDLGIPSIVLMESAGRACADEVERMLGGDGAGTVLVLCGPGNNGGDGFVIARTLVNRGGRCRLLFAGPPAGLEQASADVRTNARLWRALGGSIEGLADVEALPFLSEALGDSALVVDALFGTGLTRPLRDPYVSFVRAVNASARPVLAVDLPSGLDADTGEVLGEAIRAACTVTFVAAKPGFTRGPGPAHVGRVLVAEIGIPTAPGWSSR